MRSRLWLRTRQALYRSARAALRVVDERDPSWRYNLRIDHPPGDDSPRYGHGRARHARLGDLLDAHDPAFRATLATLAGYAEDLLGIPTEPESPGDACWDNGYLPVVDTIALYGFLRDRRPSRYVEIGSGFSTALAHRAKVDGALATTIVSIDPEPRAPIDALCDERVRTPLELTDLSAFEGLRAGDVVFLDASHRVLMQSDTVVFFLDVLPGLPDGVLVGIHDIYWPEDYPGELRIHWYSEQYLLGAYLLAGTPWIRPVLSCRQATLRPDLLGLLAPILDDPRIGSLDRSGTSFWFEVDRTGSTGPTSSS